MKGGRKRLRWIVAQVNEYCWVFGGEREAVGVAAVGVAAVG